MLFTPGYNKIANGLKNNHKWTQWACITHIVIFHLNIYRKGSKVVSKRPNSGHLRDQAQKYDRQLINKGNIFFGRFDHISIRQIIVLCIVKTEQFWFYIWLWQHIESAGNFDANNQEKTNLQHQTFLTCLQCLNNDLIFKKKSQQLKYVFATHKEMNVNKRVKLYGK